jgi:hypothetical protein
LPELSGRMGPIPVGTVHPTMPLLLAQAGSGQRQEEESRRAALNAPFAYHARIFSGTLGNVSNAPLADLQASYYQDNKVLTLLRRGGSPHIT